MALFFVGLAQGRNGMETRGQAARAPMGRGGLRSVDIKQRSKAPLKSAHSMRCARVGAGVCVGERRAFGCATARDGAAVLFL